MKAPAAGLEHRANRFGASGKAWPEHWIKLQRDTPIESFLNFAAIAGLLLAVLFFIDTRTHTRLGFSRTPLRPSAVWLACRFVPCPPQQRLVLRREAAGTELAVEFSPRPWWRDRPFAVLMVLVAVILAGLLAAALFGWLFP